MQLPSGNYTACSHHDITASKNEIPERWFQDNGKKLKKQVPSMNRNCNIKNVLSF